MKKIVIVTSLLLICYTSLHAQIKELPKSVIVDYAQNLLYLYKYNEGIYVFITYSLKSKNYSEEKIITGMQSITTNKKFREATFDLWYDRYGSSYDYLFAQFKSIDMSAKNAEILADYIIDTRKSKK